MLVYWPGWPIHRVLLHLLAGTRRRQRLSLPPPTFFMLAAAGRPEEFRDVDVVKGRFEVLEQQREVEDVRVAR